MRARMKFESLTLPSWNLPDLVEFNRRVHERVDPLWEHLWVRRLTWAGLGLFVLFGAVWLYFATGLPSSEKLLAYEPKVMVEEGLRRFVEWMRAERLL